MFVCDVFKNMALIRLLPCGTAHISIGQNKFYLTRRRGWINKNSSYRKKIVKKMYTTHTQTCTYTNKVGV